MSVDWANILLDTGINVPILLIGGTYDLITPLLSEQFKIFLSTKINPLNRFVIIEGASHFSPIRVLNKNRQLERGKDVFKISKDLVGSPPNDVQNLSLKIIVEFLNNLDQRKGLNILKKSNEDNLNYYILGRKEIINISNN